MKSNVDAVSIDIPFTDLFSLLLQIYLDQDLSFPYCTNFSSNIKCLKTYYILSTVYLFITRIYHFEQFNRKERKEERKLLSVTNGVDLGGWRSPSTFNRAKSINSLTKHVSRANRAMNNQRFIHDHSPLPSSPPAVFIRFSMRLGHHDHSASITFLLHGVFARISPGPRTWSSTVSHPAPSDAILTRSRARRCIELGDQPIGNRGMAGLQRYSEHREKFNEITGVFYLFNINSFLTFNPLRSNYDSIYVWFFEISLE